MIFDIFKKAYVLMGFLPFTLFAQDQSKADSLILIVEDRDVYNTFEPDKKCLILTDIAFYSSLPEEKMKYANAALKIADNTANIKWQAVCHMQLGNGERLKGNLADAIFHYLKASKIYTMDNNILGEAVALSNIADTYSISGNHANSIESYKNAIKIFRLSNDSLELSSTLLNAGDEYFNHNQLDSALLFFAESKNIYNILGHEIGVAYALGNIGLVHAELGENLLAEKNINEAINILLKLGDFYPIAVYQTYMAEIYAEKGDLERALKYAHNSWEIGNSQGLKEQIRDASLKLSELYQAQGEYRKAYDYQSQYITYRDSINSEEVIRKMADLRTEYEVGQKQAEVDLKQTEVDLLNEQARNNQIVLWSVIVILVLALFLVFTLMKVYRVKVRAIRIVRQRRRIIAAQRNQLEEVNRTKDKFFSIISHDIRGPISNFQGVSQLIHLLVESKDYDGLLKLGTMLDTSTKEVSSLLDNLLEWAMSQQGRMPYKPETIKLHELCNSNLSIMENLATAKQITLTEKIKEKVSITADKNSVSTIIRNLVSNAIKFTPEGGSVDLQLTYDLNMAVLIVKDSGIGIPQEKMEHLFDFKGERSRWGTDGEKGVGLGLTLVHEFTELNKGKIEVESEEGKGTTFKVYLPLITE